ncbi:PPOX class probable F420-dependent enzyme [Actinocorallia herbida]|uniref:PPOX class probable F420-dependent enzyme n=1 Tax=Actinocorallia herbida TaxID=58109 RepID=A0A3N1CV22_9ACTN|nr:PPOX class F420-dependent oxidoreductase [Actinocorallia herbida]ROO85074.1 PPOX class probable F420-dependent enzyme [Actinocorallia herbida]
MGVNQRGKITMTDEEVAAFLNEQRVATLATNGPSGRPHLVAMWYAVLDGVLWFETKAKSQKAANLRRDGNVTVMVEAGHTYDQLRGVSLEGTAVVVDDPAALWEVGVSVWERYSGPYSEEVKPLVEVMLNNRVAVRVDVERIRSWDHRKLGMPALDLGGSTAAFL